MRRELSDEAIQQIQAELFAGRKVQAVIVYRQETREGLAESLAFINAVEARLRQESPERFAPKPPLRAGGCLLMVVCSIAVIGAILTAAILLLS
jgi:hypothetical protein